MNVGTAMPLFVLLAGVLAWFCAAGLFPDGS
jgi:hypothetical protein